MDPDGLAQFGEALPPGRINDKPKAIADYKAWHRLGPKGQCGAPEFVQIFLQALTCNIGHSPGRLTDLPPVP
jgi:hypothetical protein